MKQGKTIQDLIRDQEEADLKAAIKLQEEEVRKQELERQREQRRQMMAGAFGRGKEPQKQQEQVQITEKERQALQLKELQVAQKQQDLEKQRQERAMRMQRVFEQKSSQQQPIIDDSKSISKPIQQNEQVLSQRQKEMLDQRANAFKNRGNQIAEEIKKQENEYQRMQQFEQEAMNEFVEEKKAEARNKTIQIQSVLDKRKEQQFLMEIDQSAQIHKQNLERSIQTHSEWLMQQLFEQSEALGDVEFVFPNENNLKMRCHSFIISAKSPYFNSLIKFQSDMIQSQYMQLNEGLLKLTSSIDHFSYKTFQVMKRYFYLGELEFDSNDLIEMLELCQEYLLYDVKQLIEHLMVKNVDIENFADYMHLCRVFDCKILKEFLFYFSKKNYQQLKNKGSFKTLQRDEWMVIKEYANI
ncbi:UNKNOWN [Stylonychia lemnae]|uniref:BTB domain-containing protein n=1 Tax=Stylonychia lemnae TaxID=5949 RepID=A0A078B7A5_STYLE|nr:UNKNOWN [Stylonychia lemnae]|eukprot:CDW89187.1 UNKNOWN [Stylonychia lemnae]